MKFQTFSWLIFSYVKQFRERPETFSKKRLQGRCFPVSLVTILRTLFLKNSPSSFFWTEHKVFKILLLIFSLSQCRNYEFRYVKYTRIQISLTRIFPLTDKIYESSFIRKNNGQWKLTFLYILCRFHAVERIRIIKNAVSMVYFVISKFLEQRKKNIMYRIKAFP